MHGTKGLEFENLLYVAVTRAKSHLCIAYMDENKDENHSLQYLKDAVDRDMK